MFSFVSWPFSLKILWAPLVDSLYFKRVGQRRTWLLPVQARAACAAALPSALLLRADARAPRRRRRWWAW